LFFIINKIRIILTIYKYVLIKYKFIYKLSEWLTQGKKKYFLIFGFIF
jgi:hypothetical protein